MEPFSGARGIPQLTGGREVRYEDTQDRRARPNFTLPQIVTLQSTLVIYHASTYTFVKQNMEGVIQSDF